jgi:hypothetical protein
LPSRLFIIGGAEIGSYEGTTQGDPLAMPFYALSLVPLIQDIHGHVSQAWYADDAQASGQLIQLRIWWDLIVSKGSGYGYHANSSKTILIVKPERVEDAKILFGDTDIVLSDGARDLGAAIGSTSFKEKYVSKKISTWCSQIESLSKIAISSPQAAHAAFIHGLRHRWTFLQRTMQVAESLKLLEDVLRNNYIPSLLGGRHVDETERKILSLPTRYGGLSIDMPSLSSHRKYETSQKACDPIINSIIRQDMTKTISHQQNETEMIKLKASVHVNWKKKKPLHSSQLYQ